MIIIHNTDDMFDIGHIAGYMVNPVNLQAAPGKGLALEFVKRVPQYVEEYRQACRDKSLRIGTIQVIRDTGEPWDMINLPTKVQYVNDSDPEDIKQGLIALRNFLKEDAHRYSVVVLPMLGCGLGKQDYPTVFPMMVDYLSDLDAPVFVCMSPKRIDTVFINPPRYLTIAGPLDWGHKEEHRATIRKIIDQVMQKWEMNLSDYEGIVSGGYPGVDQYVCGEHYLQGQDSYIYQITQKPPLVVKPNRVRDGVGANLHLGNLLCEIGHDVILFKPKGHNNNRLSAMQVRLQALEEEDIRSGRIPRRKAIWGDTHTDMDNPGLTIPEEPDVTSKEEMDR